MTLFFSYVFGRGYELLERAAELNHTESMSLVAEARLFGDHLPQNMSRARELLEQLAVLGHPRGQMVSVCVETDCAQDVSTKDTWQL